MPDSNTPKKFLKKRSGVTGKLMEKIHYPNISKKQKSPESEQRNKYSSFVHTSNTEGNASFVSVDVPKREAVVGEKQATVDAAETARPYTGTTADSGYRDEVDSVVLSYVHEMPSSVELTIVDVTNSSYASADLGDPEACEDDVIIRDITSEMKSSVHEVEGEGSKKEPERWHENSVGHSVAEFRKLENVSAEMRSPSESSENSGMIDGKASQHWRQVIRHFEEETEKPLDVMSASEECFGRSSSTSGEKPRQKLHAGEPSDQQASKRGQPVQIARQQKPIKLRNVSDLTQNRAKNVELSSSGINAQAKKPLNRYVETKLLEKSLENLSEDGTVSDHNCAAVIKVADKHLEERRKREEPNLAIHLRDLIAKLERTLEDRRKELTLFETIANELLREKRQTTEKLDELKKRNSQLEDLLKTSNNHFASNSEKEQHLSAQVQRLQTENICLRKLQREKKDDQSDTVTILKEQVIELQNDKRNLEVQLRAQRRKHAAIIREKDSAIEGLQNAKARLEKRSAILSKNRAVERGRIAQEALYDEAVLRASQTAPVKTSTKILPNADNAHVKPSTGPRSYFRALDGLPSNVKSNESDVDITDTCSDIDEGEVLPLQGAVDRGKTAHGQLGKRVRWKETVATAKSLSPLHSGITTDREANADMLHVITANNLIGQASLYRSAKDFTIYTSTHCGCHFYEYGNRDVRWIHPSNLCKVYYFGQAGATTVEIPGKYFVRHFLSGQLEIYRISGETTLVTSDGRRTEVMKDESGAVRVHIFGRFGQVRLICRGGVERQYREIETSCIRADRSYVYHNASDDSYEWCHRDCVIRRFKNGDVKVSLNSIDTSISLLVGDLGTVRHSSARPSKYCAEWGTSARKSRLPSNSRRCFLNQL